MDACWPAATPSGEEPDQLNFITSVFTLTHILRKRCYNSVLVWDFRTGVVLSEFGTDWGPKEIAFSGNRCIVGLYTNRSNRWIEIYIYDALKGTLLRRERHSQPANGQLNDHWIHEGCLRFATSFKGDGKRVVTIREFQPTSNRLVPVIESFPVPPHDGVFSFSPVSFHASLVTEKEVVILDVRKSETLLHNKVHQPFYKPRGYFSPDGHLFACGTRGRDIFVWKNTSTGYVHWSTVTFRLQFLGLSFSPTTLSILTWGPGKIQLLHPEARDTASPKKFHNGSGDHLVAHCADRTHIATVRRGEAVITVLDLHSGCSQQSIETGMVIQDIKVVGSAIFVTDGCRLASWHLEPGGFARGVLDAEKGAVNEALNSLLPLSSALSNDCSKITFGRPWVATVYDINAGNILGSYSTGHNNTLNIRFSPDDRRLLLTISRNVYSTSNFLELDLADDWPIFKDTDPWSWADSYSSGEYHIGCGSRWVADSRHRRLLWLPPSWRVLVPWDMQWIGDFLVLLNGVHPEPIIIEFQPQPLTPPHQTPSPDI